MGPGIKMFTPPGEGARAGSGAIHSWPGPSGSQAEERGPGPIQALPAAYNEPIYWGPLY